MEAQVWVPTPTRLRKLSFQAPVQVTQGDLNSPTETIKT
jgi:hypothetical protein